MPEQGISSPKSVLAEYLAEAAALNVSNVLFSHEEPLPEYPVNLDYIGRLIIPLTGLTKVSGVFEKDIECREIVAGDFIYTPRNCWIKAECHSRRMKSFSIVITPDYVRLVAGEFADDKLVFNPYYHTNCPPSEILLSIVHTLNMLRYDKNKEKSGLLVRALLLETIDMVKKDEVQQLSKSELSFKLVKEYIDHNYHLPINVEQICHDLGYNPSYISRMFKKLGNQNIKNYLEGRRMTAAKEMLSNVKLRLAQIARQCGYSSEAYFIKVFKKFYGITPGEFRLENQ